jgi:hypothetical protein
MELIVKGYRLASNPLERLFVQYKYWPPPPNAINCLIIGIQEGTFYPLASTNGSNEAGVNL